MLNILVKDFKILLLSDKSSLSKKILSLLFSTIMLGIFIAIEVFLFTMIINKVKIYDGAAIVYLTLFLFIISCVIIILDLLMANKLFFNEKDIEQLTRYPISNEQIILSKLVFLFATHFFTSFLFTYPIFIAFGNLMGRAPMYYFSVLFYPVLTFLFEAGVALIFVYPFKLLIDYLKKHVVVQFVVAIVFMFGACFLYSEVLNIFMDLVVNNNLNKLFTVNSLHNLSNFIKKLIPIKFLVQYYITQSGGMTEYICISLGIFLIGVSICIFAFSYFRNLKICGTSKEITGDIKVLSLKKILIKKELVLLFKDSNNIFSFVGLLIVQPFLLYLVVSSLNNVFSSGAFAYYMLALPNFISVLDIVLIMLFTIIINSGANNYIGSEKKTMRIMKTIPVSAFTQMMIKVGVPFVASCISLTLSTLVLLIFNVISLKTFFFGTFITIILLLVFEIISLKEELSIKVNKQKSSLLSSIYSYLLPIAFLVSSLVLSYFEINIVFAYLISLVVIILLGLPFIFKFKSKTVNKFLDLEVVN